MANKQTNNLLGKKIKELRLKKKLFQDEVARKAHVLYTTLTKIEAGVIKKPSLFAVAKIVKTLSISLDKLINT